MEQFLLSPISRTFYTHALTPAQGDFSQKMHLKCDRIGRGKHQKAWKQESGPLEHTIYRMQIQPPTLEFILFERVHPFFSMLRACMHPQLQVFSF